jgi:hypothetical protein
MRSISQQNSIGMFPRVLIPDLLIHTSQIASLESSLNTPIANKNDQGNIKVADKEDKLNRLDHHFGYFQSPNGGLGRIKLSQKPRNSIAPLIQFNLERRLNSFQSETTQFWIHISLNRSWSENVYPPSRN